MSYHFQNIHFFGVALILIVHKLFSHMLEILEGKGPMSSTGIEALLYMKTNDSVDIDPEYPDIEILQTFATVAFDTCNSLFSSVNPLPNQIIINYFRISTHSLSSDSTPRD